MVGAMGYQESCLAPNARSHRGAVGIIQLLPSTAADRHVAIDNIERVDNNIHAAVKYLSHNRSVR